LEAFQATPSPSSNLSPRPPKLDAWDQTKQTIMVKVTRVIVAVASNKIQKVAAMLHPKENIKMIPRNRDTTINLQKQGPFVLFKKQLSTLRQLLQSNAYATQVYTYMNINGCYTW
jgi:hypothetical protein